MRSKENGSTDFIAKPFAKAGMAHVILPCGTMFGVHFLVLSKMSTSFERGQLVLSRSF